MNKFAIVTGGSKGIGYAIAKKLISENIDVLICSRTIADLEEAAEELSKLNAGKVLCFAADLSHKSEVDALVAHILAKGRNVDLLVNNTGTFVQGTLMTEEDGALEAQINTNLYSAYWLTRGLISVIKNAKGHIFNMCSIASLQAYEASGSYTISKFALLGFSKSLRAELIKDQVKVTSIMPGATYTSSWEGAGLPESRFISSADIADTLWAAYALSASAVVEDIVIRPLLGDI